MSRKGQELISPTMVIVVVLCSEFHVDLLIISTAVFAQGTNTSGLNNQVLLVLLTNNQKLL